MRKNLKNKIKPILITLGLCFVVGASTSYAQANKNVKDRVQVALKETVQHFPSSEKNKKIEDDIKKSIAEFLNTQDDLSVKNIYLKIREASGVYRNRDKIIDSNAILVVEASDSYMDYKVELDANTLEVLSVLVD